MTKKVFLTGATGFLGSHFLLNFMHDNLSQVYVLIRGATDEIRKKKLYEALHKANSSYSTPFSVENILKKVTIVSGDLEFKDFGVEQLIQKDLIEEKLDEFWHFAASLSFEDFKRDSIKATNIDGTANAVHFSNKLKVPHFMYISTAYTCGAVSGNIKEELHSTDRRFSNFYEESKCHSEHNVTQLCKKLDIGLNIFRPSVVIGNSETKKPGGSTSGLYGFLRELKRLKKPLKNTNQTVGIIANKKASINFIPINLLMNDLKKIHNQLKPGEIYHLTSYKSPNNTFFLNKICEILEIPNLKIKESNPKNFSSMEKILNKHMVFYSGYFGEQKKFEKKIMSQHEISELDIAGYVIEGLEIFQKKIKDSFYDSVQILSSDKMPLHCFQTKTKNKKNLLFCNAVGMPSEFSKPLAKFFSDEYNVVTLESRTLPNSNQNYDSVDTALNRQVLDAYEVMEHFHKGEPYTVIGWCSGARIAQKISELYPHKVNNLILLNGYFNLSQKYRTLFQKGLDSVLPKIARKKELASLYHKAIFSEQTASVNSEEKEAQKINDNVLISTVDINLVHLTSIPFQSTNNLFLYSKLLTPFIESSGNSQLNDEIPTLILTGENDKTASPEESKELSENNKKASFINLKNSDHFSLYNDSEYLSVISDFLG